VRRKRDETNAGNDKRDARAKWWMETLMVCRDILTVSQFVACWVFFCVKIWETWGAHIMSLL
jgi:hypothetical protein